MALMPATAWDLFCSAWFSVISHWLTANSSFGHRSCSLSGWQCSVVLLCSARFIFSVCLSQASAFLWPAMWPALRYRGPNNALLTQTAISLRTAVIIHRPDDGQTGLRPESCWSDCLARRKSIRLCVPSHVAQIFVILESSPHCFAT